MLQQNESDYTRQVDKTPSIQDITYVRLRTDGTPNQKMGRFRSFLVRPLQWLSAVMMVILFILLWSTDHLQRPSDTDLG
jgi:hypothetical protein